MTQQLKGKTALVTGGGSGIGESISLKLASQGAKIVVVDMNLDAATATAEKISAAGGKASAFQCDVSDQAQVDEVFAAIQATDVIDVLINNAGIAHVGNLEKTSEADLDRLYRVNVKGVYNSMRAVIEGMKARHSGVIINMASVAASVAVADRFAYSMTKGAVLTMTYSVAKDYIHDGIRCNCISPARVHTPFVDNFLAQNYPDTRDEMFEKLSQSQPLGRMGQAEEVAGLVAYLCSDQAAFITGTNIPIDGGFITLNS